MSTDVNLTGEDVWEVVQDLALPLALIELEQYTVVAATPSLLGELGVSAQALLHQPVFELFDDADRESSKLALDAIANGLVDFYRSHRRLRSLHNAATMLGMGTRPRVWRATSRTRGIFGESNPARQSARRARGLLTSAHRTRHHGRQRHRRVGERQRTNAVAGRAFTDGRPPSAHLGRTTTTLSRT